MSFRLIYELAAPRTPDLKKVQRQIEIFGPIVDAIFIPDNHLASAAMSSVALGIEVMDQGFRPIVGLNARDRNELRLASDLITLKAYGIEEVMFLYGDPISTGRSDLTVRKMLANAASEGMRRGVAATIGRPLGWKKKADFLMTQLAFGRAKAGYWREWAGFSQPVYCGVVALKDRQMAEKLFSRIPELTPPEGFIEKMASDDGYGFQAALDELTELHRSGIDGSQIVVPAGWKRFAAMLGEWAAARGIVRP